MILRERIVPLRKALHKTQEQVADELFLSPAAYCSYERQLRCPSFETLAIIADYYGVSVDYLTGRTDIPGSVSSLDLKKQSIFKALPSLSEQTTELLLMALLVSGE